MNPQSNENIKCSQANSQKFIEQEALAEFFKHHSTKSFYDLVIENYELKRLNMQYTETILKMLKMQTSELIPKTGQMGESCSTNVKGDCLNETL